MKDLNKFSRWSLERVQFMLSHIEDFIDDESQELRERAKNFVAQTDLDKVEDLVTCDPTDLRLPVTLLERLTPFFDAGLLLQRGLSAENGNWWVTDLFWRGNTFHLDLKDQVRASSLVPEITPLQAHRAPAKKVLSHLKLDFICPAGDADAFLVKPTPVISYVLINNIAAPWTSEHVTQAHRLINKCFIY